MTPWNNIPVSRTQDSAFEIISFNNSGVCGSLSQFTLLPFCRLGSLQALPSPQASQPSWVQSPALSLSNYLMLRSEGLEERG